MNENGSEALPAILSPEIGACRFVGSVLVRGALKQFGSGDRRLE